jgi:hypothetical protein
MASPDLKCVARLMRPDTKSAKHALDAGRASSLTQSEMVCAFDCVRTSVHMKCSCVAFMVDGAACCWRHQRAEQAGGVWSHGPEHKVHPAPKNALRRGTRNTL